MNTTSDIVSSAAGVAILSDVWSFILATRAELLLFCVAVAAYMLLFGDARKSLKGGRKGRPVKLKQFHDEHDAEEVEEASQRIGAPNAQSREQTERAFQVAFESGDHRGVLRCWSAMKHFDKVPSVSLAHVVESMQRFKKDAPFILRELRVFLKKFPECSDCSAMNDLLETVARRLDSELAEQIVKLMVSLDIRPDQRTYEILLGMHFTTRSFSEVRTLVANMKAKNVPLTTRAAIVIIKTALKTNNFEEAVLYFRELKSLWTAPGAGEGSAVSTTPSLAPRHIVSQLVDLACKDHHLNEVLPLLNGVPITDEVVGAMLQECVRQKDSGLTQQVEKLAREQDIPLSDATYSLLVRSLSEDPSKVTELFNEVVAKGNALTPEFATALLAFCTQTSSITLANRLFEYMKPKQPAVLSAFIRFYTDTEQLEKACDVYEQHLSKISEPETLGLQKSVYLDARMERSLMNAALRCGRHSLAKNFLDAAPSDISKHITMIRNCAATGNLQGAKSIFDSLKQSGTELNSVVYNTVLDACVECRDLFAAEDWMRQTKEAGLADVVSYNTLIKAHLHEENFSKARALMEEMRSEGLQPNRVTYNELVNSMITKGLPMQRSEIWSVISEMRAAGVKPNQVTCSILLKNLTARSSKTEVQETMELINAMDEPMDEVLLSSVVEACVRVGQPELLSSKLRQLSGSEGISISGSHTFGSLIKAYGHAKDIDGVWRCWKEMRSRMIRPTSITLGCMVEAVVSNGDTEGAYELIHQMQEDERCCEALNSVIYCSVLKGFTREKKLQRVWAVYEEMLRRHVDLSVVTYNTLADACARCGRMDRVPQVLEDMKRQKVRPNLITYSTMLKGHCQTGDIQKAFSILQQMRAETHLKPDEIMYNSLLDGCAQNNLVEEGLQLLEQMQAEGVVPSNFTLSLLVKLMNRARKLDKAFALVDELCRKYKFRPNVHVYTNLIQACIANRNLHRGMSTFENMLSERITPDNRTYVILIRASLQQARLDQAVNLLRQAVGLPLPSGTLHQMATCPTLDHALVGEVLSGLTDKGAQELALPLLSDLKEFKPRVRIDAEVQRAVMTGIAREHRGGEGPAAAGRGGRPPRPVRGGGR